MAPTGHHKLSALETHGLGDIWYFKMRIQFLSLIKQRIFDIYHQSWYTEINNSPRSSSYSRFKHSFIYLSFISDKTLRKYDYSNTLKILPRKNENFQIKNSEIFQISAQNIDCGYSLEPPRWGGSNEYPQSVLSHRGGSNEYPQSMCWAEIRKIMHTPVNPRFTI